MSEDLYDVIIIGGGIVGMATAMTLSQTTRAKILVLEAEDQIGRHQTGNNSGVIHSGIYYKPGSLKAENCVSGREALYQFAEKYGIAYDACGKLIVATKPEELPALETLYQRGLQNGLTGIRKLDAGEIKAYESYTTGIAGLHVPQTGIIDYPGVLKQYNVLFQAAGGELRTNARMLSHVRDGNAHVIITAQGEYRTKALINCAGLQSDRIAQKCGVNPGLQIVPFRGEYYEIIPEKQYLVKNLIYPVPDPRFPFLGVHFTRRVTGGIEAGPNAVLAFKREGYRMSSISPADMLAYGTYSGFYRMAFKFWKTGIGEMYRSLSKAAFVKALQVLLPDLKSEDLRRGGAGVRAQALEPDGKLTDDFRIVEAPGMIHVLNAPSPAATASLSIGKTIAAMAADRFALQSS